MTKPCNEELPEAVLRTPQRAWEKETADQLEMEKKQGGFNSDLAKQLEAEKLQPKTTK